MTSQPKFYTPATRSGGNSIVIVIIFTLIISTIAILYYSGSLKKINFKNPFSSDIDIAKNYKVSEGEPTIEQALNKVAGVTGKIQWKSFTPEDYNDPDISAVEVNITKTNKKAQYKSARFQYLINKNSKEVKMVYAEINEKNVSIFEAIMILQLMAMDI